MTAYSHFTAEEGYQAVAQMPLPEAAVVIDVRQRHPDEGDVLLAHLQTELADLTAEMQAAQVPAWSHLLECIAVLQLVANPSSGGLSSESDFLLTSQDGQQMPLFGRDRLVEFIGTEVIDFVRTCRLKAVAPADRATEMAAGETGNIRLSTVRVFFLADMQEAESLSRAATYAHWFKAWTEQQRGRRRTHRNELIHTVVLSLNSGPSYHDTLLDTLGPLAEAIDTVILLQKYSDDEAALYREAQTAQAELLLYTLLLRWPDVFWKRIDDPITMHEHFLKVARTFPWPTYIIGVSSLEYSARWSARWLNYGVGATLLESLGDEQKIALDRQAVKTNVQKWLNVWWQDVRAVVPDALSEEVNELQPFARLQALAHASPLARSSPLTARERLAAFQQQVDTCYGPVGAKAWQRAVERASPAMLSQLKWVYERSRSNAEGEPLEEAYSQLIALYEKARKFLGLHFQEASGAIPRALCQLSALKEAEETVSELANKPLVVEQYREQVEQQVEQASNELSKRVVTWRLPFFGRVLRSTVVSWLLAFALAALLLFAIDWQTLFWSLTGASPFVASALSRYSTIFLWGWRVLLLLLVLLGEWAYLSVRNRSLHNLCQAIDSDLRHTLQEQLRSLGDSIAARFALDILRETDLYAGRNRTGPYERRLRAFEQLNRKLLTRARQQQQLADSRIEEGLERVQGRPNRDFRAPWPLWQNRREYIAWSQIEDAFLRQGLAENAAPANLLAEMLLRLLGTEKPAALLADIWQKRIEITDGEARFQAVSTLLIALLLSAPVANTAIPDILPLLQEYATLQDLYEEEYPLAGSNTFDPRATVRALALGRARGQAVAQPLPLGEEQVSAALASWVSRQQRGIVQDMFAWNSIIEHLEKAEQGMQLFQALDDLSQRGTLSGYTDEVSGEDSFYLFSAPGASNDILVDFLNPAQHAHLCQEPFPDREKLIYMHVHRIQQLLPPTQAETQENNAADRV
jgi:hypothetical protein